MHITEKPTIILILVLKLWEFLRMRVVISKYFDNFWVNRWLKDWEFVFLNLKNSQISRREWVQDFLGFQGFLKNLKFVRQIYPKCLKNGFKIQGFLRILEDFCLRVDLTIILRLMVNLLPLFPPQILRVILENSQISRWEWGHLFWEISPPYCQLRTPLQQYLEK